MSRRRFVPCHVHSHYSLLEGVDSPDVLLQRAAECGYSTLALTDTNNLYGAVAFTQAALRVGVRPVLGACLRQGSQRCTALIAEPSGYESLCRILSRLHLLPDVALAELLIDNPDGLHLLIDDLALGSRIRDVFGPRLWMEVIRPGRSVAQERVLLEAGQRLGLHPVASTAAHFATAAGYAVFRLLAAVKQGTLLDRLPQKLPIAPAHHLVDAEMLHQRFRDLPEAIVNAERLAEQCRSDVLPRGIVLPPAPVPHGHSEASFLRLLCERGLRRRFGEAPAIRQRLEEELHIINQRLLAGYFLVVRGIARHARRQGYDMALRGSAGNSLVCFLLGITNVDPLRFDLPLERFLHGGRPDLPDIDLDFDWKIRDKVIASVFARYGEAHTAMISSHLFLQPASAFREAAKIHGLSNEQISQLLETWERGGRSAWQAAGGAEEREDQDLAKATADELPVDSSDNILAVAGRSTRPPRSFPLEPERWPRLLRDAQRLLGRPHHLSVHPGGVVITPRPIENYVPLQRAAKGVIITQFEKDAIEQIGLVKIDLLGNRALSTVGAAGREVRKWRHRGEVPNERNEARSMAPRDPKPEQAHAATLCLLQRGDTLGLNQLESPAMRHLLVQMQPKGLIDVIQALALIRPGAASIGAKERFIRRRRGLEPVAYEHHSLESVLHETCGLMLYEDDALRVVQALTGCSAPEADHFRKQITKCENESEAAALSQAFVSNCLRNEVPRAAAEAVWIQLAKFNSYSFCKSHAVSYGLIAWEAAQLKATAPLPFWVAALNNNQGMYPRRTYIEAIKRIGIPIFLPCINRSAREFTLEGSGIRTGLGVIRFLPEDLLETILADRQHRGSYTDLRDFQCRISVGPETLGALIQVGAFDFSGESRPLLALQAELHATPAFADGHPETGRLHAQRTLPFASIHEARDPQENDWSPEDYTTSRRWRSEWHLLGFLVGPPLMRLYRPHLPPGLVSSQNLPSLIGKPVRAAGLVATARHTTTKHGENMQFITLEDEWGFMDVTLFPNAVAPRVTYLGMGPYLVAGIVEEHHDVITITASRCECL